MSTTFSNYLAALARVRAGTSDARILIVGDSTSWGLGAAGNNPPVTGSYPAKLRALLANDLPASFGLNAYGNPLPADARWTLGSGWSQNGASAGLGSFSLLCSSGASGNAVFAPGYSCDTADIYYVANGQYTGTSTVGVDGGTGTALTTTGGPAVNKTTITFPSGSNHNILVGPSTGGIFFLMGVDCYDSLTRHVRVSLTGVSSSTSADWAAEFYGAGSLPMIRAYAPDLTILMLGINDAYSNGSPDTLIANLGLIITAAQQSGDVLLCSMVPSQDSQHYTPEQTYVPRIASLAASAGCGYADVWTAFGGSYTPPLMSDALHPNDAGYSLLAQTAYAALPSVTPAAPAITSAAAVTFTKGTPGTFQLTATGATPIDWSAVGLPAGCTLSTAGLLSYDGS